MTVTKEVEVVLHVKVTVDETKFTQEFMTEFRRIICPLYSLDDHLEHLAQMYARGVVNDRAFIEGYGQASGMGIKFEDAGGMATTLDRLEDDD